MREPRSPDDALILYDGACVFCSGWVRFIVRRDRAKRFRFTPMQSPYGRQLAETLGIDPDDPDTNAVILDGLALRRSDGALATLALLPGWGWVRTFRLLPRPLRDGLYTLIARNRYRLFGTHETCDIGAGDFADRVIWENTRCP
jgi:predicted DCC family thiol-disulfide oxidoreductase YuxK